MAKINKQPIPPKAEEHESPVRPSALKLIVPQTSPPLVSPRFTLLQKLVIATFLALGLFFSSPCYPDGYDILRTTPKQHDLGKFWTKSKDAQRRTLAMLIEMYPDYELYFLERDARLLGQTGLLMAKIEGDESLQKRIHFLNVSRANKTHPLLSQYLKQEGISEESLAQGKKFLFIDTGFVGSIPRGIMQRFPGHEAQFGVQMMVASPADHEYRSPFPSTRVFGTAFSDSYPMQDILEGAIDVVHPYASRLPKSDLRSDLFVVDPNGKIQPDSTLQSRDINDGEINPMKTRQFEEDLHFYLNQSSTRLLNTKLRDEWRKAHQLWQAGKKSELVRELEHWINVKGVQGVAMAFDLIEMTHTNLIGGFTLTPPEVGLPLQEINQNETRLRDKNLIPWQPRPCRRLLQNLTSPPPSSTVFPE